MHVVVESLNLSIFTKQDSVIAKALIEVMAEMWHRLCTWHMMQNGIKKL